MKRNGKNLRADGGLIDKFNLLHGIWDAKDGTDDLEREVRNKFEAGYPSENILFQAPERIIIVQNGREVFNDPFNNPQFLIRALKIFFEEYQPKEFLQWEKAADEFKDRIPEIGRRLLKQIWLDSGMANDFDDLLAIGSKEAKAGTGAAIFKTYSQGVSTSRRVPWSGPES